MNIKNTISKTRNLSAIQLFDILQQEYIVCELRAKIYPLQKHKDYWIDLMEKKKEKIIDISNRNKLFSIFDNKQLKLDFEDKIIPKIGFPNFIYRDDHQRLSQEKWDIHNYYLPKQKVSVYSSTKTIVGIIISVDFLNKKVKVLVDNNKEEFNISLITRIL